MQATENATLQRYIERVQAAADRGSHEATTEGVVEACRELAAAGLTLGPEYRHVPEEGHGRNLVFRDPERGFVIVAMVWPPGHKGCPHDHASWCVLGVLEGTVDVVNYRSTDDGADAGHVALEETDSIQASVGAVSPVQPPPAHWHVVSNASDTETAITLHTYGTDLARCRVADLATGEAQEVETGYHNLGADQG